MWMNVYNIHKVQCCGGDGDWTIRPGIEEDIRAFFLAKNLQAKGTRVQPPPPDSPGWKVCDPDLVEIDI